jgi:hypothetical protein
MAGRHGRRTRQGRQAWQGRQTWQGRQKRQAEKAGRKDRQLERQTKCSETIYSVKVKRLISLKISIFSGESQALHCTTQTGIVIGHRKIVKIF